MYKSVSRFMQRLASSGKTSKRASFKPHVPEKIKNAKQKNRLICGRVINETKGGYRVDIEGFIAFCPYSEMYKFGKNEHQTGLRKGKKSKKYNNSMEFIVIEVSLRSAVVSSKRAARIRGLENAKNSLASGVKIIGVVKNILPYGAFVDIGGVDGLLHISEFGDQWIDDIGKHIKFGQHVNVHVIDIDEGKSRVSLSLRGNAKYMKV